jgi:peptide/nickel transport system permease protein
VISYFLIRLCYYLSIFLGIIFFSFILFHIVPSDPARIVLGPNANQQQVDQLRTKLGLDRPLHVQFAQYFERIAMLDFGHSYVDNRNVFHEVSARLGITLSLIAITMIIVMIYLLGIILSFIFPRLQKGTNAVDFLMSSFPVFFSGIIVALFTIYFYPMPSFSGKLNSVGDILYLIAPALVLGFYPMAILAEILKKEMSSVLKSLYITAEKAWGFSEFLILFKYALKNTLIPILSALSNILPVLLTGAFIVEVIFSIPGIGSILIKSILERDFPMLECTVIVNGAFFVFINLIFEYLYPLVDPRVVKGSDQ